MLADWLVVLSLCANVFAAAFLAYDAIWAQGARFQRDAAQQSVNTCQQTIDIVTRSIRTLPGQYTEEEKEALLKKELADLQPGLESAQGRLDYWSGHPARVQNYALIGIGFVVLASVLQGAAHLLAN